jgi:hypothetical protein
MRLEAKPVSRDHDNRSGHSKQMMIDEGLGSWLAKSPDLANLAPAARVRGAALGPLGVEFVDESISCSAPAAS